MKHIAVLTSGGDSPGMNAAVRAVVRSALAQDLRVYGVKRGYDGLIRGDIIELDSMSVSDTIQAGGTFLGSARSEEFLTPEGQKKALDNLKYHGIEGVAVVGGDGSFRGAHALHELGMKVVGIPGTIDNDIVGTTVTIGFDTAVNTVIDAVSKLRDTASAHNRIFVVEVMGRHAGWIALYSAIAGGADVVLIPEVPFDYAKVVESVKRGFALGKTYTIIIVAEGAASGYDVQKSLSDQLGKEHDIRVTILGHVQRGGAPSAQDRILASRLGAAAVTFLLQGKSDVMAGMEHEKVVASTLDAVFTGKRTIDKKLYELADVLST
jgi:6-phosphofructokinase 1